MANISQLRFKVGALYQLSTQDTPGSYNEIRPVVAMCSSVDDAPMGKMYIRSVTLTVAEQGAYKQIHLYLYQTGIYFVIRRLYFKYDAANIAYLGMPAKHARGVVVR